MNERNSSRLYTPQDLFEGQILRLEKNASQHLLRVLRARLGDSVIIFNGKGGEFRGKLIKVDESTAVIELIQYEMINRESSLQIHLHQAIPRGEKMDFIIQKATELGVATITPLFTSRTVVKLSGERLKKE